MNWFELVIWAQQRQPFPGAGPGFRPGPAPAQPPPDEIIAFLAAYLACVGFMILLVAIPTIVGAWKAYQKAGEPGWAVIVPVYSYMVMARIAGKSETFGLLVGLAPFIPYLGPIVFLVLYIMLLIDFVKPYGQGGGFAVGLALLGPIFWPILGFGSSRFRHRRTRRFRDEDEDDDRPRRRRRARDEEEEEEEERPRRRRAVAELEEAEEEEEERPKRRRAVAEDEDRIQKRRPAAEDKDRAQKRRPAAEDEDRVQKRRRKPVEDDDY
jgi:hypothetical protein